MKRIVLQFGEHGGYRLHADEPVEFYTVDERFPEDRVIVHSERCTLIGTVDAVLGDSPIGYHGDGSPADVTLRGAFDDEPPTRREDQERTCWTPLEVRKKSYEIELRQRSPPR